MLSRVMSGVTKDRPVPSKPFGVGMEFAWRGRSQVPGERRQLAEPSHPEGLVLDGGRVAVVARRARQRRRLRHPRERPRGFVEGEHAGIVGRRWGRVKLSRRGSDSRSRSSPPLVTIYGNRGAHEERVTHRVVAFSAEKQMEVIVETRVPE